MSRPLLTTAEVAELLRTSTDRVVDRIGTGELVAINIGSPGAKRPTWRVSPEALDAYIAARSTKPTAPKTPRRRQQRNEYTPTYY